MYDNINNEQRVELKDFLLETDPNSYYIFLIVKHQEEHLGTFDKHFPIAPTTQD